MKKKQKNRLRTKHEVKKMKYAISAPVGENMRELFVGMKEFPAEQVILEREIKDDTWLYPAVSR